MMKVETLPDTETLSNCFNSGMACEIIDENVKAPHICG